MSLVRRVALRAWILFSRTPVLFDRRGLRWLNRLVTPAPLILLVHRGRRSGRVYTTPIEAIDEEDGEVFISPMFGERGQWYRNVVAGGLVEVRLRGQSYRPEWRELPEGERRIALERYRKRHPLYGRIVLWGLTRLHRLSGDAVSAVAATLPMLALRKSMPGV